MTTAVSTLPMNQATPSAPIAELRAGLVRQVMSRTVARASAKICLVWIGILAGLAVFAPFIANSNPYLIELDGHWSSPFVKSLGWTDWSLLGAVALFIVAIFSTALSLRLRVWGVVAGVLLIAIVTELFITPPANMVYEFYRDAAAAGRVSHVLNAPIPYSASDRQRDRDDVENLPPSRAHWLGTEENGGDVASRLLHACRVAMSIGLFATGIAIVIGVVIGGLMGYFAGTVDILGMRLIEVFEAIPTLFLMITLVAFFPSENYRLYMLMAVIGVTGWTGYARFLRAEFLRLRDQDFVHAATAAGLRRSSILFRHMLPNGITPVVISASFSIAGAIVSESSLSFLHLGTIDQPSWGGMLAQSISQGGTFRWWLAVFPGVAIFITVFAYNVLGEALNDALDPKREQR